MRKLRFSLFFLFIAFIAKAQDSDYFNEIQAFQKELNESYKDPEDSPLSKKDIKRFEAHDFFEINKDFRIVADFKLIEQPIFIMMKTSTTRLSKYKEYAKVSFTLKDKEHELIVYQSTKPPSEPKYIDYLFLPFTDLTNGESTYDIGRYLDLKIPDGDTIVLDFNKAYNPYCAYSKNYSCPIPPEENHLRVEVNAGIQKSNL